MQGKKILFLFLALLFPICVFIFLKMFGKNEFAVPPLYQDTPPEIQAGCTPVKLPYKVPHKIQDAIIAPTDSLVLVYFKSTDPSNESQNQIIRTEKEFEKDPLTIITADTLIAQYRSCVFFLKEPNDLILIDHSGLIRGQYVSNDREEVDRLITEVDIILKKY